MAQQTTLDEWAKDPLVDPEIRAHVYSLISAVSHNPSLKVTTNITDNCSLVESAKTEHMRLETTPSYA